MLAWLGSDSVATWPSVYYVGCATGEVAESAEGSRLLSGYRAKSSVQGSNPCLSAKAPLAQMDRASDYESEGRGFDSLRAHQLLREVRPQQRFIA